MTDNTILEVRHLSKSFGSHQVLRDIDFTVSPGDVTSILGASGSGKSTICWRPPPAAISSSTVRMLPGGRSTPPPTAPG